MVGGVARARRFDTVTTFIGQLKVRTSVGTILDAQCLLRYEFTVSRVISSILFYTFAAFEKATFTV